MPKEFRKLIPLDEAKSIVLSHLPSANPKSIPLKSAFGHILAEKIISQVDVPGFDRASMDGYAIRAKDSIGAREDMPISLKLIGQIPMGKKPHIEVGPNEVAGVSTGSMMPPGSDSVVMVEYTEEDGDSIFIRRPVHIGENVLRSASDIMLGETVLTKGTKLTAREIGVLAAIGRERVNVRQLGVGVASTGNELVMPGQRLKAGQVYDINSYSIAAASMECGAAPTIFGILPDDFEAMAGSLKRIAEKSDLVVVSGSTSAGIGDILYHVVEELGEIIFHGINLKPGKPTIFGTISGKPFFGLPGYPTSALTVFGQLVAPMIREVMGTDDKSLNVTGRLARPVRSEGRRQMLSVGLVGDCVYPVDKGSGSITTLSRADGVMEIPEGVEYLDRGEEVEVHLFGDFMAPGLLIAGEDCPLLEVLMDILPFQVRFIATGTRRGAISVEDGVADLALVCDYDLTSEFEALIRGYSRDLGIMSKDPDLLELSNLRGKRIMGWFRESEMSKVLNDILKKEVADGVQIVGQARTHSAVAAAVASGRVDVGFGARAAAEDAGLLFLKVIEDEIDFIVSTEKMKREAVQIFIETLRSEKFGSRLPEGFKLHEDAGAIIK